MTRKVRKTKKGTVQRAVLLRRAGIAGGLILALLVGLAWYERSQSVPDLPRLTEAPPPPPLPTLEEPLRGAPPMPTAEEAEASVAGNTSGVGADGAVPELTAAPAVVAPEARTDETPPAASGAPRLVLGDEAPVASDKPALPPAPESAPKTVAKADVPATKVTAPEPTPAKTSVEAIKNGYMVQLGVFSAPGNAQALIERVDALGIPAHIESRVVVGPFKDRSEADAARRKLSASGLGKGLVVRTR